MNPNEISQCLNDISKWKENILLAELAVSLHNLGKCHEFFLQKQAERYPVANQYFYDLIAGSMRKWVDENLQDQLPSDDKFVKAYNNSNTEDTKSALLDDFQKFLWDNKVFFPEPIHDLISESGDAYGYPLGFFIDFQRVKRWFSKQRPFVIEKIFTPWKHTSKASEIDRVLRLAQISHAICSEYEDVSPASSSDVAKQEYEKTFQATAFGYETGKRVEVEKNILTGYLSQTENKILESDIKKELFKRVHFYNDLEKIFQNVISETVRPKNDCTLWDFAHTAGSFFKAFFAWSVIEPGNELWQKLGTEEDRKKLSLNLQYLTISWDYFQFVQSSTRIIDLLSRKAYLDTAIGRLRNYLELEMPIANQIFKDENGLVFLAPGCCDKLINQDESENTFRKTLEDFFLSAKESPWVEQYAELIPDIQTVPIDFQNEQKNLGFGKMIGSRTFQHTSDAEGFQKLWQNVPPYDVCPVCGLRPIGYDDAGKWKQKADDRGVCRVCEERRIERSQEWIKNFYDRTIWIDEVCDKNGRAALIVGKLGLNDWFDESLKLDASISKIISFARARRIWETTETFWKQLFESELVEKEKEVIQSHCRLRLAPNKITQRLKELEFHSLEAQLGDQNGIRFPVYWDGELLHVLGEPPEILNQGQILHLKYKAEKGKARELESIEFTIALNGLTHYPYIPFIEILKEPSLAMALVPAEDALTCVSKIKEKYDCEMGKVKDRLPLNLGIVFFPKNTPIAPVIDAGRRMSQYSFGPEKWRVIKVDQVKKHPETGDPVKWEVLFEEPSRDKNLKIQFDTALGNGKHDEFHCKLLKVKDDAFEPTPISDIKSGDFIRISPSHFDFIFLDQAGKRFELELDENQLTRYNETLNKPAGTRPYLLEDFTRLEKIWEIIKKTNLGKSKSALHGFRDLLLQKYRSWKIGSPSVSEPHKAAYLALVENAINKEIIVSENGTPRDLTAEEFQVIFNSIIEGVFFDCLELHLHILKEKLVEN